MKLRMPEMPSATLLAALEGYNLLPAIVFLPTRRRCDQAASEAALTRRDPNDSRREARRDFMRAFVEEHPEVRGHRHWDTIIRGGVASHHAGHIPAWKLVIEKLMSAGLLDAIFATATVAAGVDFPARSVVLFGGVNSVDESIPVASHKVFGDTWQWDGSEWTQVQDMGPKGRWQHAMAFESTESRIVLFGGLTVFAPAGDPSLAEALLGDTWVHNEPGGAPPVPLPVPPPVVVESAVTIQGAQLANIGDSISVSFTLSNPDSVATVFVINKVVAVNLNGETASPEELSHLRVPLQVRVEPGLPGGTFNVVRDPGFMHPGTYGIQVAVQGTATEHDPGQVVTFTVA